MTPAEAFHPSEYIREEMDARDWGTGTMAARMGGDYHTNKLALEMYLRAGPLDRNLRLGMMAADVARAFGTSVEYWENLERAWLEPLKRSAMEQWFDDPQLAEIRLYGT